MARLDGKQKSPLPLIIGVAALLLIGAGAYVLLANRGADGILVQNGNVKVVDTQPGGLLEKSPETLPTEGVATSGKQPSNVSASSTTMPAGTTMESANSASSTQETNTASASTSHPGTASAQEGSTNENSALASPTTLPNTAETPAGSETQTPTSAPTTP